MTAYFALIEPLGLTEAERWQVTELFFRWIGGEVLNQDEHALYQRARDAEAMSYAYVCQEGHSESIADYRTLKAKYEAERR